MYYKAMSNDAVVGILRKICYVRYLPKAQRWVATDSQSAQGILNADGTEVFALVGRAQTYPADMTWVQVEEIGEAEYMSLASAWAMKKRETDELREEISDLKAQLEEQNSLLQAILAKL